MRRDADPRLRLGETDGAFAGAGAGAGASGAGASASGPRKEGNIASPGAAGTLLEDRLEARALNKEGLGHNKEGQTRAALACFERAHKLDPAEPKYALSMANMLRKLESKGGSGELSRSLSKEEAAEVRKRSLMIYENLAEGSEVPEDIKEKAREKMRTMSSQAELPVSEPPSPVLASPPAPAAAGWFGFGRR